MNKHELFMNNVGQWVYTCPKEANTLLKLESPHVSLCQTGKGEWNIKREGNGEETYYHSPNGALEEAKQWFEALDLYNIGTLFVYGVGLGYYYQAAKEWLIQDHSRSLIFLEDDLEVIHVLFETELGRELLSNTQVRLQYFKKTPKEEDSESDLFSIPIFHFLCDIRFSALKYYLKKFPDDTSLLGMQLEYIKNCKSFQIMEYMNYGETYFQNFYRNLLQLPAAYLSEKLYKKFEGIPAIICGAGPSLQKSLPLIEKLGNRAVIFAGGSSINILNARGILPHFGVSIDPNWNQYARLFMNQSFLVPFFYRNRIFPQALSLIQGDHLYVPGSGGHKVAEYFENNLGIEEETKISEGNNVVNFSISIAEALGCNPIILVGVDLAYTDNQSYSPGIIPHPILDANKEITTRGTEEELIIKKDIYGNEVHTLWKWITESMWISQFAATSPRTEIINATEGGIGFDGVRNVAFNAAAERFLDNEMDLKTFIHGETQNASMPPKVTKDNIIDLMKEMQSSLERCQKLCAKLRQEFHKLLKEIKETGKVPENLITEKSFELLRELNKEPAYENVLNEFNKAFISFFGQREKLLAFESIGTEFDQVKLNMKRTNMNKRRYEFLKAVTGSSIDYINEALEVERLTSLVSDVFGKQIEEAKAHAKKDQIKEESVPGTYKSSQNKFWIEDESLGVSFEEELISSIVKETNSVKECIYNEKSDNLHGCYKLLYPSGSLKMEQYYKNGKLHGPSSYYSEDGTLLAKSWFVNGLRQGIATFYYLDGDIYSTQRFKDGKWEGKQEYFYPKGQIKSLCMYKDGILDGTSILFYSDGFKKREINFDMGRRHGLEIVWNIGGIKEFEGRYQLDKPAGIFRSWYAFGNPAREITYDENGIITNIKGWDSDGTPLPTGAVMKKDYFDLVKDETNTLTDSLENVYKEVESMTTGLSNFMSEKAPDAKPIDFSEDMEELKKELENLKAMNVEMNEEANSVSKETAEALWKTPEAKRLMGQQIQNATQKMAEDIQSLEEIMRMTSEFLSDQKKTNKEDKEE
jgi:antitoxin component YwqK of YwqJK toxin-antitoxin module